MRKLLLLSPLLIFFSLQLTGCSSNPPIDNAPQSASEQNRVKQALYAQYQQWKGVKYKMGGMTKTGVDCSGFVYLTYQQQFNIKLPRSTDEQVNVGPDIHQRDLTTGDLVFFRTGRSVRHVGIYLEDGKFLHASTEKGVMLSNLDDQYWARTYWKSVRVQSMNGEISDAR
jgi:cell wall-associated NlpC family hydrolase